MDMTTAITVSGAQPANQAGEDTGGNMRYKILTAYEGSCLENDVLELINDGWTPLGGVAVAAPVIDGVPAPIFLQAMIKTD